MTDRPVRLPAASRCAISFAIAALVSPATAIVEIIDDVKPAAPAGFGTPIINGFGIPTPGLDENGDGIYDWLEPGGNNVFTENADPDFPNGAGPFGVAWNDPSIWIDYDTPQNIVVGETGAGRLTINAGTDVRYQHLVLGAVRDGTRIGGGGAAVNTLTTAVEGSADYEVFRLALDLPNANAFPLTNAFGTVVVTGSGSTFNNDPSIVPGAFQTALNLAAGNSPGDPVFSVPSPATRSTNRVDAGYDVIVGLSGGGRLEVTAGGQVQIQDALMAAVLPGTVGDVLIDGVGSYLVANGITERTDTLSFGSTETTSFIGGGGRGTLTISNSGRADFANGLSIGYATGLIGASPALNSGDSLASGLVTVTGAGSTLTASQSSIADFTFAGGAGLIGLAVGETRSASTIATAYDPVLDSGLNSGELRVSDGASVVTSNAAVGALGRVELAGGDLIVASRLENDGAIQGFGTIQANVLETSPNSRINGADNPLDNPMVPNGPLRMVLGSGAAPTAVALTNRGVIGGVLDASIAGAIDNQGVIEAAGAITGTSLYTRTDSRLIGGTNGEGTLRMVLTDNTDAVTVNSIAGLADNVGALQNRGEIAGSIDFTVAGGFVNGDVGAFNGTAPTGSAGGALNATGRVVSGSFINHRYGVINVGVGESLALLSGDTSGANPGASPFLTDALIVEDGVSSDPGVPDGNPDAGAEFTQANLGVINVNGGSFEAGRLVSTLPQTNDAIDHNRLFRNARAVNVETGSTSINNNGDEMVGTITASDATLSFREGVYNTGVIAFTGGSNAVAGQVINAGFFRAADDGADGIPSTPDDRPNRNGIDYDGDANEEYLRPGVIVASGEGTNVSFADNVTNTGLIGVGPGASMSFLGDLNNTGGTVQIAADVFTTTGSVIQVAGDIRISGGGLFVDDFGAQLPNPPVGASFATSASSPLAFATSSSSSLVDGVSLTVLDASGALSEDSLFTVLDLPELDAGLFWDVVYDFTSGEVRLEVIQSIAAGLDFSGDGLVNEDDVAVWTRNAGILSGASVIQGDGDGDGDVDLTDYSLLMAAILNPGSGGFAMATAAPGAIPEPTAAALTLAALAFAGSRRRG